MDAYIGCIAGAALRDDYLDAIGKAGFSDIQIVDESIYSVKDLINHPTAPMPSLDSIEEVAVVSIKVFARKPEYGMMNNRYDIRFAREDDEIYIKTLLQVCGLPWADVTPQSLRHFIVAWDDEEIVGVVGMEMFGGFALFRSLAVRPDARKRGLASQLIEKIEAHAREMGIHTACLLTTTIADILARRGYDYLERSRVPLPLQVTAEFKSLCPVSAVCMIKHLSPDLS